MPYTRGTNTEEENLVILNDESIRSDIAFLQGAPRQFVGTVAHSAMEVVVMSLAGPFVQHF
jgi:hypothetical protein